MKLTLTQSPDYTEPEVDIRYAEMEPKLQKAIDLLREDNQFLNVRSDNGTNKRIRPDSILYFASVDEKTFVYSSTEVFSSDKKLYELEEQFKDSSFVRISKACILNIDHLDSVKVLINGRLEAKLLNGEKLIINRHYVSAFKKKLG